MSTPIPFTARRIPHTATHNRIVSGTRQLLASAISLYLLALVIHLVLRLVLEDRFRLLAVANLITPFYFLPLVVVIPLALVAGILALMSIVYSYSRGGFIGLVVALTVWIFLERSRRFTTLLLGGALALGLLLFAPKTFWERNETMTDLEEDASAMGRVHAWEVASNMSSDNPLLGVGAGGFRYAWPLYAPRGAHTAYVAHNVYLDVVGELGFIGLFLFLVFTGGAAGGALLATQSREIGWMANGIVASVAGYVVCNLFSGYTLSAHFYVLFGLAAAAERVARAYAAASRTELVPQGTNGKAQAGVPQQAWEV